MLSELNKKPIYFGLIYLKYPNGLPLNCLETDSKKEQRKFR